MQDKQKLNIENLSTEALLQIVYHKENFDSQTIYQVKQEIRLRDKIQEIENQTSKNKQSIHLENQESNKFINRKRQNRESKVLKMLLTFIFSILCILFIYILSSANKDHLKETTGTVYEVEEVTSYAQGFEGIKTILHGYIIRYYFEVGNKKYFGSTYIKNNNRNQHCIPNIKASLNKKTFIITYETQNIKNNNLKLAPLRKQTN